MFFVTLKVLKFRYACSLRHRWLLTVSYMLFALISCSLAVLLFNSVELVRSVSRIQEHDERSLLRFPDEDECAPGRNDCQLKIVVCPDGDEERELMDRMVRILRLQDETAVDITYVRNTDQMKDMLVNFGNTTGLYFHEISSTTLNYTIRPRARHFPSVVYDWGDYATTQKFPSPMYRGPRLTDPYFNVNSDDGLIVVGFLTLQVAVDKAYVDTYFPNLTKNWILTSFPYPPYIEVKAKSSEFLPHKYHLLFVQYLLILGITFMISVFATYTINDRRSGIREWLFLNGATGYLVDLSWLVSFGIEASILAVCEMLILKLPTLNGPTVEYMSPSVLAIVLILHNWSSLCWAYLIATVTKRRVLCVSIIATHWAFTPLYQWIPPDCFFKQVFLAVLPNAGIVLIFKSFQEFDGAETVLGLDHLMTYPIHYPPVGILLVTMFATSVMLIVLSMYVNLVNPGLYGRARPWYIFTCRRKTPVEDEDDVYEAPNRGKYFEEFSGDDPIGLECEGVSKFIRKKTVPWWKYDTAVKNVSMKIPKNKITVVLGQNGSGKTTLLSILSCMNSPSVGHLYTEEREVFNQRSIAKFRKVLGYCPQNNMLMNELTIRQHLIIFGLLKGLSRNTADENSKKWVDHFSMEDFENTKVENASGVAKRKLCLAIALTGEPQCLILDDPSSGLDVESLRRFWSILLQMKGKCTAVFTTNNMDEAELLGDYFAFMVKGQLKAYGSRSFLKEKLDNGYKIDITVDEQDRQLFFDFIGKLEPAIIKSKETHNTVSLEFPVSKAKAIPSFLRNLESEFGNGVHISVSDVSVGDGLFKLLQPKKGPDYVQGIVITERYTSQPSYYCGVVMAIFKKKISWICQQCFCTAVVLLLLSPMLGIYFSSYYANTLVVIGKPRTADLKLTMDEYNGTVAFISKRNDTISAALRMAMRSNGIIYEEVDDDMVELLNRIAERDLFVYRSQMVFAFDSREKVSIAYFSRNAFHSAPIAYSALMNAILPGNATIFTHNFPYVSNHKEPPCSKNQVSTLVALLFQVILGSALLVTGSYFVIFPHVEGICLFKHLQLTTGLLPWVYWTSHLMFDVLTFSIRVCLIMIIMVIMDTDYFTSSAVREALITVFLLYGISTITLAYVCSFCRASTSVVMILFVLIPPLLLIGCNILSELTSDNFSFMFDIKYLYFLPWVILMQSLEDISMWAAATQACYQCNEENECAHISDHSLNRSLKTELISFAIISLGYLTLCIVIDHGFGRKLKPMVDSVFLGDIEKKQDESDSEMGFEKKRVRYLETDEEADQPRIVCDGLGKKFSSITAVRDVTFAHERGQLLGILGTNGSGKSTLLGMLSGTISPTTGSASIDGKWGLGDCEYKYIKNIGFCPQSGGVLLSLTGRETMRFFGRLRGLKSKHLDAHVDRWLQAINMFHIANVPCEQYSPGNRRKLSFAIAMIGFPIVAFLDDPTAGIDPIVQSRIWSILHLSLRVSNQAIILASPTMSEVEASDRLVILMNGEIKFLGSVPKLQYAFGRSCTLYVKLKENSTPKDHNVTLHKILRESRFSRDAKLQQRLNNMLKINVNIDKTKSYEVFSEMFRIKEESSAIENFSLSETPLDEVFVMIAKQSESKKKPIPKKVKYASTKPR